jgi:hypothetical protein
MISRKLGLAGRHQDLAQDGRPCSILVDFGWYKGGRSREPFKHLLEVMVHEIAHHFELEDDGHGDRWQTCCAALAHCFGLTLKAVAVLARGKTPSEESLRVNIAY